MKANHFSNGKVTIELSGKIKELRKLLEILSVRDLRILVVPKLEKSTHACPFELCTLFNSL